MLAVAVTDPLGFPRRFEEKRSWKRSLNQCIGIVYFCRKFMQHYTYKLPNDDDVFYLLLQKQKFEPSSIYTFRKVRTIRGCLEGLALMI